MYYLFVFVYVRMSEPESLTLQSLLNKNGLGNLYAALADKDVTSLTDLVIFLAYTLTQRVCSSSRRSWNFASHFSIKAAK